MKKNFAKFLSSPYFAVGFPILFFLVTFFLFMQANAVNYNLIEKYPIAKAQDKKKIYYEFQKEPPATWVNLSQISPYAIQSIVISEDWAFFDHDGLDINQLKNIIWEFLGSFHFNRGGSTITQQVVKNLFLTHERSYWRKLKEMIISYNLEKRFSKKRILEVYLNIIEFGPNVYGIENASLYYFKKPSQQLTLKEGAFLAMLLPNPKKYSESYRINKLTDHARETISDISIKLRQAKFITEEERVRALKQTFSWEKAGMEAQMSELWDSN